jgi:hypothetical protein
MRKGARVGAAVLALCSCGDVPPIQGATGSTTGGLSVGTVDITTVDPTESGEPTGGSNSAGGLKFDVGSVPDAAVPPGSAGCKLVDVVISIDNSGSMQEEIEALAGPVFDSFPQALLDVGNGLDDFQLGVIDACNDPPFLHDTGAGGACNYSSGTNYMVSSSPALFDEYHCVTELTQSGYMGMDDDCSGDNDDEQPANTAAGVVGPPAVDGANAGFLRDDAVLFVVAITDEDEQPVPDESAQAIADKIIAAKGTVNNVVFLGIGGGSDCDGPYGSAEDADLLRAISQIFADQNRGLFWDLCQGDLEQAFDAALQIVDSACIEFEPPA